MKFILGKKLHMTQVFDKDGKVIPVTAVTAGPAIVTQIKTVATDGYNAVQVGFGKKSARKVNKAQKGHFKDLGSFLFVKEFRIEGEPAVKVGDAIDTSAFAEGDIVEISATSKGKGFQGVVKRHGFHGGPRSHGQKHSEREPGSISGGTREGGRVPKGMRMAGRMGSDRVTLKGVAIVGIDAEKNEILLKGAVPGRRGTLVEIKAA